MLLNNTLCAVRIRVDETFVFGSNDYERYDVVLNPCDLSCNDLMKTFSISIELQHRSYTIALVGSCLSCESDCAILEDNTLLMLLDDVLVTIDVLNGTWSAKPLDWFGGNFGIFRIPKGYIIHGEVEITMLNEALEKQWSFSGKDIFATQSDRKAFSMSNGTIELYDWEDNYYQIDFEGNLIRERAAK